MVVVHQGRCTDSGYISRSILLYSVEGRSVGIKDKGPGIKDVDLAMQAGYSTASENVRALGFGAGMGLPNMKKYSDEMNIETEIGVGTTVTMKVYF